MKTQPYISIFGVALVAISFAACGGGDGPSGNDPTLGITSIQSMGGTAIQNDSVASGKPTLAKHFMKGIDSLFGQRSAHAVTAPCPTNAHISFNIPGGKIWLDEVFMILDEVQFNTSPTSSDSPDDVELGPFALDLLNTDPDVNQAIDITVPPGKYNNVRFRVKRVDDTQSANSKVPARLIQKILGPKGNKRRPSVWIKGWVSLGTSPTCRDFIFVTDRRWEETIAFTTFSGDIVDAILELNLEKAFNAVLTDAAADAIEFRSEIGVPNPLTPISERLGDPFLDGRTKDKEKHGTPIAKMIADKLPWHFRILIQTADTVNFEDFPIGTTLIDDSASAVSQAIKTEDVTDLPEDPET